MPDEAVISFTLQAPFRPLIAQRFEMSARITRRRALIAIGATAYQIPVVAAFVTYFAVLNGKAEDFCLFGWNPRAFDSWYECVLSYNSIIGQWGYWAKVFAIGYSGVSALMLVVWAGVSYVTTRQRKSKATAVDPSQAPKFHWRCRIMSYDAAAIILVWSLAFASISGFFPLVSMMLFFVLAAAFALVRRIVCVATERNS